MNKSIRFIMRIVGHTLIGVNTLLLISSIVHTFSTETSSGPIMMLVMFSSFFGSLIFVGYSLIKKANTFGQNKKPVKKKVPPAPAEKVVPTPEKKEKKVIQTTCIGCGANVSKVVGENSRCEYCGSALK